MKKLSLIALTCLVVACSKETAQREHTPFVKGQTVSFNLSSNSSTKVVSALNQAGSEVEFKWEAGDQIKVIVKGTGEATDPYAIFELKGGAGTSVGRFEGNMPAGGTTYDVQYPVTYDESALASQSYSATEALPHNAMLFKVTDCSIDAESFTIVPQYSAIMLQLWGKDKTISKIQITNSTNTYTLTASSGVSLLPTIEEAKPFFIVVRPGDYLFSAEVFDNASTPASICKFEKLSSTTLAAGEVLAMNARKVIKDEISGDFSVSATQKVRFAKGNLQAIYDGSKYIFRFAENQYDNIGNAPGNTDIDSQVAGDVVDLFGWSTSSTNFGISASMDNTSYAGDFVEFGTSIDNKGTWRTLTNDEWTYLLKTRTVNGGTGEGYSCQLVQINFDKNSEVKGLIIYPDNFTGQLPETAADWESVDNQNWLNMENEGCIFLPCGGYRNHETSVAYSTSVGRYWSSTGYSTNKSYRMAFRTSDKVTFLSGDRYYGSSVRLATNISN